MMEPNFEIKYLEIKWYDKSTITKVTESLGALRVEYDNCRGRFRAETTIYPKLEGVDRGQLAVRFFEDAASPPYIKLSNGKIKYFALITDPDTNQNWWIIQEKWDEDSKQWYGIAPNIAGTVSIVFLNQICELSISGFDFSRDQLEQYLQAFKNDLWELILDESSPVRAEVKQMQGLNVTEEIIDCINSLVSSAENVLLNPKVELREIQALKPRKSVKPVNRTFKELVTKSNHRYLTGRSSIPSCNVAENRYILFALERCYRIVKQIVVLARNKRQRYQDTVRKLQVQHDSFTNTIQVSRDMFVADLEKIKWHTKIEYWEKRLNRKLSGCGINLHPHPCRNNFYVKTENSTNDKDGFFILVLSDGEYVRPNNKAGILSLRNGFTDLAHVLDPGMVVKINCNFTRRETPKAVIYELLAIHSITLLDCRKIEDAKKAYVKERTVGIELSKNNWIKKLSRKELEGQDEEKLSLLNRIEFYTTDQNVASYVYEKVEPKLRALKKIIQRLAGLDVKSSSYFPNSMTFVQNPNYQGVHNNYRFLREITHLNDDELLKSLEKIDEIGLVNMPLLYERWVLMQLLLVLKDSFRFQLQDDWKYKLISAIKDNRSNIMISLLNGSAKRKIDLWYEKELPNGKRPDFILDLTWRPVETQENSSLEKQRFVLDAKFYDKDTFCRAGGMIEKIDELYHGKNYSEDQRSPVFLIHPCTSVIDKQVTAQEWGKYSFLGEIDILNNGEYYSHNRGAILLNPISRSLYNDELQRLLGLFLQYKLESKSVREREIDITRAVPICIRCGSSHINQVKKSSGYYNKAGVWIERTDRSVWMQCSECQQMQIYNHCANTNDCDTRLIKNGLYWSYHSARAIEPFNMKCPSCGEWGAW